jgi:hypothetical protein
MIFMEEFLFCVQIIPVWHSGLWPPPAVMLQMAALQHVPSGDVEGRHCDFDVVVAQLIDALTKLDIAPVGDGVNVAATVRSLKVANAKRTSEFEVESKLRVCAIA